jgi:activating signal cointegrator 1
VKALTIYNPWAWAIAWGLKEYETRSWKPTGMKAGDLLGIHAGARFTKEELASCNREPMLTILLNQGIRIVTKENMPCGAMLAIAELIAVWRTEDIRDGLTVRERGLGNYANRRYAWQLKIIHRFEEPISCAGAQQLWNWELPVNTRTVESLDGLTKVGQNYYDRQTGELVNYRVWQPPLPKPAAPQPSNVPMQMRLF